VGVGSGVSGCHHIASCSRCRLIRARAAAALAYDFGDDCGIYNVGTVEKARRRGLGTALTAAQVHDARARGCRTASLQSTQMAERVYAAVGFRDLGRILEYVPGKGTGDE
jgi:ribosomal protein S18 acetylase RimI-like enzyme